MYHFLSPIYILQKKVVRLITFNDSFNRSHSPPLFNLLKIITIYDIFKIETLKFVFDCLKKMNPPQFHYYFKYSNNNFNTANVRDLKLDPPQVRTTNYGLKSLKYTGVSIWNDIPLSIRTVLNRIQFIKKMKELFIASYIL